MERPSHFYLRIHRSRSGGGTIVGTEKREEGISPSSIVDCRGAGMVTAPVIPQGGAKLVPGSADLLIGQKKAPKGVFFALKACRAKLAFLFQTSFAPPWVIPWLCP
ncbi:MAG: hypothetical protein EA402_04695 [Planctomycetota bacterium]|nr:MAG: hypothetical protein EA402_04695 [Planctomycetota bacterium]